MTGCSKTLRVALPTLIFLCAGAAVPASAQSSGTVSREVVQPLPPAASEDLNAALMRLARDRRDVDALISAGLASLKLDDVDAAIGFFGRAKELSPENPRIAEGMGAAYVRGGRPVEALNFFEEAENGGINTGSLWADRGLAYDLVGQSAAAQAAYQRALSLEDDNGVRQRLALSYAISGNRRSFEDTLKPLLEMRDFAAYRTRAFGLAILGNSDEAVDIAEAVMPRDLAGRMEPYLRFMPRLTPSQQAAAANLGIYPSASRIGRDDPRIVSAARTRVTPSTSDAALEPRGPALGASEATSVPVAQVAEAAPAVIDLRGILTDARSRGLAMLGPVEIPPLPPVVPAPTEPQLAEAAPVGPPAGQQAVQLASATQGQPETQSGEQPASFDLADAQAEEETPVVSRSMGLADAFADFTEPTGVDVVQGDVVDISSIEPVREDTTPPPPPAPRRIWLQLGIGQDRALLRSDWRLKYRKFDALKDKGPFVTPWGQTNRLLAGPFDSQAQAREALNALAAEELDSFIWTSPEGQQIEELR